MGSARRNGLFDTLNWELRHTALMELRLKRRHSHRSASHHCHRTVESSEFNEMRDCAALPFKPGQILIDFAGRSKMAQVDISSGRARAKPSMCVPPATLPLNRDVMQLTGQETPILGLAIPVTAHLSLRDQMRHSAAGEPAAEVPPAVCGTLAARATATHRPPPVRTRP